MQNISDHSKIHTYLFILLCLILAIMASLGTFLRSRAATQPAPKVDTSILTRECTDASFGLHRSPSGPVRFYPPATEILGRV